MNNNKLAHYGVMGMRWGVKRANKSNSTSSSKTKANQEPKKKNAQDMSDEELRKVVNRLQMERQYSQLSEGSVNKGKQYMQKVIKAGTTVAAVTTTALTIYNNGKKIKDIIEKTNG